MPNQQDQYMDQNGLLYLWQKLKNVFAKKTDVPAASSTVPVVNGTASVGTDTAWARGDHVHPTDTTRAPLNSPSLTGTPTAPTPASGTNTTQIATTEFVTDAIDAATFEVEGVIGVENGGTGTTGITGIIMGNGTSAMTAATASDITSLLGNSAVNRATADASGNNISTTYATKAEMGGVYKYRGSVSAAANLPENPANGDVYNIETASVYGAPGANVAWDGTGWNSLGEIFTITSITNAEIDAILAT